MIDKNIFEFSEKDKRSTLFHDFNLEPEVKGILIKIEPSDYGDNAENFIIEYEEKQHIIGSYSALKGKLTEADIGKAVMIKFIGMKDNKSGKRKYMDFEVFVKALK
jgi:hypothetical protein